MAAERHRRARHGVIAIDAASDYPGSRITFVTDARRAFGHVVLGWGKTA
jgi:hypothetical protein